MAKRAMTVEAKALKAQAILDKAAEMFEASDYQEIRMSELAKEMGLSNGILFAYFKTKESLFFSLLCREYEKRLYRLIELIRESPIGSFDDFKQLILRELVEIADHNLLYIRLEAMRTAILEKNVDTEILLRLKMNLFIKMNEMVALVCEGGALTQVEVTDIFQAEASIITGCKLSASIPAEVVDIIEKNGMDCFRRDFKKDVLDTMRLYLDGYDHSRGDGTLPTVRNPRLAE